MTTEHLPAYTISLVMTSTSYLTLGFSKVENISLSSVSYRRRSWLGPRLPLPLFTVGFPSPGVMGVYKALSALSIDWYRSVFEGAGVGRDISVGRLEALLDVLMAK